MPHRFPFALALAPLAAAWLRRAAFAGMSLATVPFVQAADFGIGVAAGADRGKVDCIDAYACDRSSGFWKLSGSWYANESLDLQLAGFGTGKFRGGDTTVLGTDFGGAFEVSGLALTAGYRWTFAKDWTLNGRLGAAGVRTRFTYAAPFDGHRSKSIVAPLGGLSLAYAVTPAVSVSLDYDETRFKAHDDRGSLRMLGAAVRVAF